MKTISFDIEWYGRDNRRSAICDYLELMAIQGDQITAVDLQDTIRDANWIGKLNERIVTSYELASGRDTHPGEDDNSDLSQSLDDAEVASDNILTILQERSQILGNVYPFKILVDESRLVTFDDNLGRHRIYLALLCITVSHTLYHDSNMDIQFPHLPSDVFEETLATTLNRRGILTSNLGLTSRGSGFASALRKSCDEIGIKADPYGAPFRKHANDEGCDTVSNLWPHDTRVGGTFLAGQATCAKSHEWKDKLKDVPVGSVRDWLRRRMNPFCFLSVPHHVQLDTLDFLIGKHNNVDVLDRLRLCFVERGLMDSEKQLIDATLSLQVSPIGN
ncbi:hypothetical protein [Candidatus Poriferisocius sp.]|uniref:hypothetical protein n=1 Tax=Candidatus Poriferisocius sp. TaxID=3101276 RepID=UPI003B0103B1